MFAGALRNCLLATAFASAMSMGSVGADRAQSQTEQPPDAPAGGRTIAVYFSHDPESYEDFGAVREVSRTAIGPRIATAALQSLIEGPTPEEHADGYFSDLSQMLSGASPRDGADF